MTRRCWQQILAMVALAMFCLAGNAASEPSYKLTASSQKDLDQLLVDLVVRSPSKHAKLIGYESLVEAARNGCPSRAQLDRIVEATAESASDNEPVEMFLLPPLVRLLYQFESCFTKEQINAIATNLSKTRQRLFDHGTINHAAMRACSWYLLAQKFPAIEWLNWDGKKYTSQQVLSQVSSLLKERWDGFYKVGHYELLSPTYSIINLFSALNIFDFAIDNEIRNGSNSESNLTTSILFVNSFEGVILPPITRKNYDQRNASNNRLKYTPSASQSILKFYTGRPSGLSNTDWSGRVEPPYVIMLALSNWRPLADHFAIEKEKQKGLLITIATPSFSKWGKPTKPEIIGSSYITENYAISAGNAKFTPGKYHQHIQTTALTFKTTDSFGQIECYHPYFSNPNTTPTWGTDRWSPMLQSKILPPDAISMVGELMEVDPWPIPKESPKRYNQIDEKSTLTTTIFCRAPKNLPYKKESDSDISISSPTNKFTIHAQGAKIEFSRLLDEHVELRIETSRPNITISASNHPGNSLKHEYEKPTQNSSGFVSTPAFERSVESAIPIESRILSLKNGILKFTLDSQTKFECSAKLCKKY